MLELINSQMYKLLISHFQDHDVFHMSLLKSVKDNFVDSSDLILIDDTEK